MADYNSYFSLNTLENYKVLKYKTPKDTFYKEHLNAATKSELIDVALEGHSLYTSSNNLAYSRLKEIQNLKTEIGTLNNTISTYKEKNSNYKTICFITISICILSISFFYIYQYVRLKQKKHADEIPAQTAEELSEIATTQHNTNSNSSKYLSALGLVLLIWTSTAGQYLNAFYDLGQASILGFRDTIIATILMLCYPFVSRIMNKQVIEYKKCKTICIANSVILLIISLILQVTIGIGFVGGLGAFIYYFINMNLFSAPREENK